MTINRVMEYLRSREPHVKNRIVIVVVALAGIGLTSAYFNGIQKQLASIEGQELIPNTGTVLSATNFITVEAAEKKDGKTYIYFQVKNDTSNIMNFSSKEKISFQSNGNSVNPEKIANRQGQAFVTRILSNTQEFGTLIFPNLDSDRGTLNFENMFFESETGEKTYNQSVEVDFGKLRPVEELRS